MYKSILCITHEIYQSFDDTVDVRDISLDISNAFDKVWHKVKICKGDKSTMVKSKDAGNTQISVQLMRKIFKNLFNEEEKAFLDILFNCLTVTNLHFYKVVSETPNKKARLNNLNKVTGDLKLSLEAFQSIKKTK